MLVLWEMAVPTFCERTFAYPGQGTVVTPHSDIHNLFGECFLLAKSLVLVQPLTLSGGR